MESRSLGSVILSAVIVGLMAGLLVAVYHFVVTEPLIEHSIQLEEALHQAQQATGETMLVSRELQREGLFLGFLMYGLMWGLLFSVAYHGLHQLLIAPGVLGRSLTFALLTGWSVALFPFLKYPANPPGVGDPETIQYRQGLYLGFIALSVVNTCLALAIQKYLNRSPSGERGRPSRWAVFLGAYVAGAAVLFFAFPPNPDPAPIPADLLWAFRGLSFAGLALFWAIYAGGFAWFAVRAERKRPGRRHEAMALAARKV